MSGAMRISRIETDEAGVRHLGEARHQRHEGLHVLNLHGGPYDMAFQHGALLREAIPRGPLPFFEQYLALFLRNSPLGPAAGAVAQLLEAWTQRRLLHRLPPIMRATAAGLADGAGLREADVLKAYLMPDAVLHAMALFGKVTRAPIAPGCACPPLGCTSAVAAPRRTARGQLLHARNMDFVGPGRWDAEPVVAFHRPEEGQPYVTLTSAGIAGGGITGMNQSGLSFAVHQHFPVDVDLEGEPVGLVGEHVLREARTLDEAIALLDRHFPMGGWTYIIADSERAVAYEVAPGIRRILPMDDGLLGYANVYQHPDLADAERAVYPSYVQANHARHNRVWAALRAAGEGPAGHTEASMAGILADAHVEGIAAPVVAGDAICTPYTVTSVVFRPADRRFWVGQGPVPTCAGRYIGFDLKSAGPSGKPRTIESGETRLTPRVQAVQAYAEAWRAWMEYGDLQGARGALSRALAAYDADPTVHHAAGLLALRAVDLPEAELHLQAALARETRPARLARTQAALAFTLALAGRKGESMAAAREAKRLAPEDTVVKRQLGGLFTQARARRLPVELLYADVVV